MTAEAIELLPPAASVLDQNLTRELDRPGRPVGTVLVFLQPDDGVVLVEAALNTMIKGQIDHARKATKARLKADELANRFPDTGLLALASAVEDAPSVCGGRQMAIAIASELRRRAAAGVRTWPRPRIVWNSQVHQSAHAVTVTRFDDQWTVEVVEDGVIMQRSFDRPEFALEFETRERARLGLAKPEPI